MIPCYFGGIKDYEQAFPYMYFCFGKSWVREAPPYIRRVGLRYDGKVFALQVSACVWSIHTVGAVLTPESSAFRQCLDAAIPGNVRVSVDASLLRVVGGVEIRVPLSQFAEEERTFSGVFRDGLPLDEQVTTTVLEREFQAIRFDNA